MIALSDIDQKRFGFRVARAERLEAASVAEALAFCRREGVRLLIARTPCDELGAAHSLERAGAALMDSLVHYAWNDDLGPLPDDSCPIPIRDAVPEDLDAVVAVAREAFGDYASHYHADPRLDRARVAEIYPSWAARSCSEAGVADRVLVADDGGGAGFATLRQRPAEVEGVLFAVAERARGVGVYRAFLVQTLRFARSVSARRVLVSTQISNLAVQRAWVRLGFLPVEALYTFHLWLEDVA